MSIKVNKIYTENPYVDELVYYTKILGLDTILKNQTDADNGETLESIKAAEAYLLSYEGTAEYWRFDEKFLKKNLTAQIIMDQCEIKNNTLASSYAENPATLPDPYKKKIEEYLRTKYLSTYEDLNPYYRMLEGKPPINDPGIRVSDYYFDIDGVVDTNKLLHECSDTEIRILDNAGILDTIYNENPSSRAYVLFLTRRISPYISRKAAAFEPIYIPSIESAAIREMYIDKLGQNRAYAMHAIYSEAYKYNSDYYDNFMCVYIVLTTMIDIITRVQEFIVRKEIFDIRSCKYLFESFGVPFFDEIPLKYQINMVKNIHTLLKYKSTAKCMVDIATLFGYDNIKIFKYYLLKDRTITPDGDYIEGEDEENKYELKFLKLPLKANLDEYIRIGSNHIDYDQITLSDPTWDGGLDHDMVKKDILKEEFNYSRTKYISVDTVYDITKLAMQQAYFFGILYDNNMLEELVTINIPFIDANKKFRVADVFTLLTILTYKFNGVKDMLMDTQSKVLYVHGFNFKADLAELSTFLKNTADNLIEDGYMVGSVADAWEMLNTFIKPDSPLPSFNQMMEMFVNNLKIRDLLISGMQHADNLRIFLIFKKLYDSLMIMELTMDYYKNPETGDFYRDADGKATYTEFLKHRDVNLYSVLLELDTFEDNESRNHYIANLIDNIVYILEGFIDTSEFEGIFSNLPVTSSEAVKQYIATVINFYKSYKVDFLGLNTVYYLDDKLDGVIRIIDDIMDILPTYHRNELVKIYDFATMLVTLNRDERIKISEKIFMDISTFIQKWYRDKIIPEDKIGKMLVTLWKDDVVKLYEWHDLYRYFVKDDYIRDHILDDIVGYFVNFTKEDKIEFFDRAWLHIYYQINRNYYVLFGIDEKGTVYFEIPYITVKDGTTIVYDDRIKEKYTSQFIPDPSVVDLIERFETECKDGHCSINITSGVIYTELYGRLIIYQVEEEDSKQG